MTIEREPGHTGEGGAAVLTLSTPMLEHLDRRQVTGLVETLVALSRSRRSEDEMRDQLGDRLNRLGIEQSQPLVDRMVENLRNANDLTIVTDTGQVLYGDPAWTPAAHDPDVRGAEDPENPDRPAYS